MSEGQTLEEATVRSVAVGSSGRPDEKTRRYDRQLRLWASSGQAALESANILVISAGATSTSILKNLVLPGVGSFTLLDHLPVTPEDAGNNFFLHIEGVGNNRAEEAVKYLRELNDSVTGKAETQDIWELLKTTPSFFASFSLIISVNAPPVVEEAVSSLLWKATNVPRERVPLMIVRTAGFYAMIGLQIGEHTVVDAHSESPPMLRLDAPFPALLAYAKEVDLDALDSTDFGHVPWVVLLIKAMENWKASHGGEPPKTYAERQELKKSIDKMRRSGNEENFDEATAQAYRLWTPTTVPSEVQELFTDPAVGKVNSSTPSFFLLLRAMSAYTEKFQYLPLVPTLPDMHTDTQTYVLLQNLFRTRADEELALFEECLKDVVTDIGGNWEAREAIGLGRDEVKEFVKNSAGVRAFRGKQWGSATNEQLASALRSEIDEFVVAAPAAIYMAFLAEYEFTKQHGRYPGPTKDDQARLLESAAAHLQAGKWEGEVPESLLSTLGEIARASGSDVPTTSALVGGLVAQEAIKFITRQYIPISGTCMIDLIKSTTAVLPF